MIANASRLDRGLHGWHPAENHLEPEPRYGSHQDLRPALPQQKYRRTEDWEAHRRAPQAAGNADQSAFPAPAHRCNQIEQVIAGRGIDRDGST